MTRNDCHEYLQSSIARVFFLGAFCLSYAYPCPFLLPLPIPAVVL